MLQRFLTLLPLLLLGTLASAVPSILDVSHNRLGPLLKDFLRLETRITGSQSYTRTTVRYSNLKTSGRWEDYIRSLAFADPVRIKLARPEARKAFWINSYNAFVLDAVRSYYPALRDKSFRASEAYQLPHYAGDATWTLDSIRKQLADLNDPRVFFVLHDASQESVALFPEPFTTTNVESKLREAIRNFITDPLKYRLDRKENVLYIGGALEASAEQLADTFNALFTIDGYSRTEQAILSALMPDLPKDHQDYIRDRKPRIQYLPHDPTLNDAR